MRIDKSGIATLTDPRSSSTPGAGCNVHMYAGRFSNDDNEIAITPKITATNVVVLARVRVIECTGGGAGAGRGRGGSA